MKQLKTLFVAIILLQIGAAQAQISAQFDERVDLISMIWRLMGDKAYSQNAHPTYCMRADVYFAPYKNHAVVNKAAEYYNKGISYDAVVSYGLHLKIAKNGKITFDETFAQNGDESFNRWTKEQKEEFLPLLNDFYRQSNFHKWYISTEKVRKKVEKSFDEVNKNIDIVWFDNFFGNRKNDTKIQIVLSLLVGQNNYGCHALKNDNSELLMPVIGSCLANNQGEPLYNMKIVLPIVIHELCHAYCNPLNTQCWEQIKSIAEQLFAAEQDKMTKMAYSNAKIMMDETFVRSCVICYQLAHDNSAYKKNLVNDDMNLGFLLTSNVVDALELYIQQRHQYKNINAFMSEYITAVNAFDYQLYQQKQAEQVLHNATYTCNIQDGDIDIPNGEYAMIITFDKPMIAGIALGLGRENGQFIELANGMKSVSWSNDKRTLTVMLKLKPNTLYSFSILGDKFFTVDGYTAGETKMIDFVTK